MHSVGWSGVPATGTPRKAGSSANVFIVEDNPAVRQALEELVRSVRLVPQCYASADEFLAKPLLRDMESCLVLDVRLPGASGLHLHHELALRRIDIPTIFMSGFADIGMSVRAMKSGAVDFLAKPFHDQDMLDAIFAALAVDRHNRLANQRISDLAGKHALLSARERDVMSMVVAGLQNKQIAFKLGLAESTVKAHRGSMMRKMDARSVADLVRMIHPSTTSHRSEPVSVSDPLLRTGRTLTAM